MKKVLFVVTDRKMGGVSIVLEDILNHLSLTKYKIDLLILNNEGERIENKIDKKIKIIYGGAFFKAIDTPISYFKKKFDLKLLINKLKLIFLLKTGLIKNKLFKERKKILKTNYDIEIAFSDGFSAIFTAVGDTPRKIHWLHATYTENDPTRRYRNIFKKTYNAFEKIVAVSKQTAEDFNAHYKMKDKILVIPNIIDDTKIKKFGKEKIKLSDKKINFISVGRLAKEKGYDRLLKVIAKLKREGLFEDGFMTIVGDGPERENLFNLKKELNLNCVKFVGNQTNPYKYVAGSDVYVSSAVHESFGLVLVEALILHKPVLATSNEATETIIDNMQNGLIVENSENGLYEGMKKLLTNHNLIKKFKDKALDYDYSKKNKNSIKTIENMLDDKIYKQV